MSSVIGVIPARFGSTRFPGKLLAPIRGKSLIQHTFENAAQCDRFDRLLVATDHEGIAAEVRRFGGEVVMTSSSCQSGTERLAEVVERYLDGARGAILVNMQGDWPCIHPTVIHRVVEALQSDWGADIGTAAYRIPSPREVIDPSVVKCVIDQRGRALYFSRTPVPYWPQQETPPLPKGHPYLGHLGIYSYRPDFLLRYRHLPPSPLQQIEDLEQLRALEHGYDVTVTIVDETNALSVDYPEDLAKLENQLCNQSTYSLPEESSPLLAKG